MILTNWLSATAQRIQASRNTRARKSRGRRVTQSDVHVVAPASDIESLEDRALLTGLATLSPGDVVITGDIPLASRCVENGALVLKHNGEALTEANIGNVLATRDLMTDMRAADPFRQGGGKPFSKADRSRFLDALETTLRKAAR
mgnify:CR=1 FL=1